MKHAASDAFFQLPEPMKISNRTIWTMWHQGFAEVPQIVRTALESWRRVNPDWRVVALFA